MTMEIFDPRTIGSEVYQALNKLRSHHNKLWHEAEQKKKTTKDKAELEKIEKKQKNCDDRLKEQKNQAVELYTYISTWGLLRLKAEELALMKKGNSGESENQKGKREVIKIFFECLEELSGENVGLDRLSGKDKNSGIDTDTYLGLTGLALEIAQEFSFWANAVYHDISGED